MNKTLLAAMIAGIMAAPMAANAAVKVSGKVSGELYTSDKEKDSKTTEDARLFGDNGRSKLQFDVTEGKAFARAAWDIRGGFGGGGVKGRDVYLGYKTGFGTLSAGRMSGALKNLEGDKFIATFLQVRGTSAANGGAYGSSSFVNHTIQYTNKVGAAAVKIQYSPTVGTDGEQASGEDYVALSVKGKIGPVTAWAGMNSYTNFYKDADTVTGKWSGAQVEQDMDNMKIGASMKFGMATVTLQMENNDAGKIPTYDKVKAKTKDLLGAQVTAAAYVDGASTGTETDRMLLMANMNLGNGLSVDVAYGTADYDDNAGGKADGTFTRVAVNKKISKAFSMHFGISSDEYDEDGATANDTDSDRVGLGATIVF